MTFEQACDFVLNRLAALSPMRCEAERPFWLNALRLEFPDILEGLYRSSTQVHTAIADAPSQTCAPPQETSHLTMEGMRNVVLQNVLMNIPPISQQDPACPLCHRPERQSSLCPYCARFHDQRLACQEYAAREHRRWDVSALDWRYLTGGIGAGSLEVVDRSDTFPDDTQLPLDEWNAKVDAILEETRRWQERVEEADGDTPHSPK